MKKAEEGRAGGWMSRLALPAAGWLIFGLVAATTSMPSQAQTRDDILEAIERKMGGAGEDGASRYGEEETSSSSEAAARVNLGQALDDVQEDFERMVAQGDFASADYLPKAFGGGKISARLLQLADARHSKSLSGLAATAKSLDIPYSGERVAVTITASSLSRVRRLEREVEAHDGQVIAIFEDLVFAELPLSEVERFEGADALNYMDASAMFHPLRGNVGFGDKVSEGVALIGAEGLQGRGLTGKGVKVGIIDFGFQRYADLQRKGEVPRAAVTRAFNRQGALEVDTVHGTACAEIVADVAPDTELYLAAVNGQTGQIIAAGQWLLEQGVHIINFSGGGHWGPHDGRAPLDRFVDHVVEQGVLWVNAAGNEGSRHWVVQASDGNRNGWVDLVPGRSDMVAVAGPIQVMVLWDDWGPDPTRPQATQDLDAYLFARTPRGLVPVAASRNLQQGSGPPAEILASPRGVRGTYFLGLQIKRLTRDVDVRLYPQGQMQPVSPRQSIGIPATARGALSVGAVHARTDRLEPYSSQGPTDDGRIKPDVSAPANNTSLAYAGQGGRFPGTSAAAPHAAGFAALLKQADPQLDVAGLKAATMRHVRRMGDAAPNPAFGHGRIDGRSVLANANGGHDDGEPEEEHRDDMSDLERELRDMLDD